MFKKISIQIFAFIFLVTFLSCVQEKEDSLITDPSSSTLNDNGAMFKVSEGVTTVFGQNDPTVDPSNVQHAVDTYNIVILEGTFNFGADGGVLITRPDVTLQGPATINGGALIVPGWYSTFVIGINAAGITVRDLNINTQGNYAEGIVITSTVETQASGDEIKIENNSITVRTDWGYGIVMYYRGGLPVVIGGNTIIANKGVYERGTGYSLDQDGFVAIPVDQSGQHILAPLNIMNNNITAYREGIMIYGWYVSEPGLRNFPEDVLPLERPAPPDWGDNGPVNISNNRIHCENAICGINIGRSDSGLNNCTVSNNAITGFVQDIGIGAWPYGYNKVISGNDLSGLTSGLSGIMVNGPNTTVENNILGVSYIYPLLLLSINMHPDSYFKCPMPLPIENCTIIGNDYRWTNQPGWDNGLGCILVASDKDMGLLYGVGTEVKNNVIKEIGRFPEGTGGPSKQILELIGDYGLVHDNRIVGLPAKELSEGIGQKMKELLQPRMKNLIESANPHSRF